MNPRGSESVRVRNTAARVSLRRDRDRPRPLRLGLVQADTRDSGSVNMQNGTRRSRVVRIASGQIVAHDAEIVEGDVGELRTSSAVADGPHSRSPWFRDAHSRRYLPRASTSTPASSSPMPSVFGVRPAAISRSVPLVMLHAAVCVFDMHAGCARPSVPRPPVQGRHSASRRCPRRETVREAQRRHPASSRLASCGPLSITVTREPKRRMACVQFETDIAAADDDKVRYGTRSRSSACTWVMGDASARPGTVGIACASAEAQDHAICRWMTRSAATVERDADCFRRHESAVAHD